MLGKGHLYFQSFRPFLTDHELHLFSSIIAVDYSVLSKIRTPACHVVLYLHVIEMAGYSKQVPK